MYLDKATADITKKQEHKAKQPTIAGQRAGQPLDQQRFIFAGELRTLSDYKYIPGNSASLNGENAVALQPDCATSNVGLS
jgi:hypothetical protein